MLSLTLCPCCSQGQLAFRLCADRETLVVLCEECALVWTHPAHLEASAARDPLASDFARQHPGVQLRNSRWATAEEVDARGWSAYLMQPSDVTKKQDKNT